MTNSASHVFFGGNMLFFDDNKYQFDPNQILAINFEDKVANP